MRGSVGKSHSSQRRRLRDASFYEFGTTIVYQARKYGKDFMVANSKNTSRTCTRCGYVKDDLELRERTYVCPACGWIADHDYNTMLNMLKRSGLGPSAPQRAWSFAFPLPEWQGGGGWSNEPGSSDALAKE